MAPRLLCIRDHEGVTTAVADGEAVHARGGQPARGRDGRLDGLRVYLDPTPLHRAAR